MTLPYEMMIGLRYLRAKRGQRTISIKTFIFIAGITLDVAATFYPSWQAAKLDPVSALRYE